MTTNPETPREGTCVNCHRPIEEYRGRLVHTRSLLEVCSMGIPYCPANVATLPASTAEESR